MKLFYFMLALFIQSLLLGQDIQIDSSSKNEVKITSKKNIFKDHRGNEITAEAYFKLLNSGLYGFNMKQESDSLTIHSLQENDRMKILGTKLKKYRLNNIHNKEIELKEGTMYVIDFWSVTCPPCVRDIDTLNTLVKLYKNIEFIAITPDKKKDVLSFLNKKKFDFNIITDRSDYEAEFNVTGYPNFIITDNNLTIKKIYMSVEENIEEIKNFLTLSSKL